MLFRFTPEANWYPPGHGAPWIQDPEPDPAKIPGPGAWRAWGARRKVGCWIQDQESGSAGSPGSPGAWCVWGAPPKAEVESMRERVKGPITAVRFTMKNRVRKPDLGSEKLREKT